MRIGFRRYFTIQWQINNHIRFSKFVYRFPLIGPFVSTMIVDRMLFIVYGIELMSFSVNVKSLSITHPGGILLGGNGIYSQGRVVIMSGVKFGGRSPGDPLYKEKHKEQRVFELGDNVVIGTNSVVLGPVSICDNVIIAAMSLVNKSIHEPGVYAGIPVKKISDQVSYEWL